MQRKIFQFYRGISSLFSDIYKLKLKQMIPCMRFVYNFNEKDINLVKLYY